MIWLNDKAYLRPKGFASTGFWGEDRFGRGPRCSSDLLAPPHPRAVQASPPRLHHNPRPYWGNTLFFCLSLLLVLTLTACNDQSQKSDPRLKYFTVLNSRVLIEGNNAEVFGEVENTGQMKFPFDVTMQADLMDNNGQSVGNATGTAEDVGPGQVRQFLLVGTVDGTRYAKLKVIAVSLQEKRQELGWPTPTPISP